MASDFVLLMKLDAVQFWLIPPPVLCLMVLVYGGDVKILRPVSEAFGKQSLTGCLDLQPVDDFGFLLTSQKKAENDVRLFSRLGFLRERSLYILHIPVFGIGFHLPMKSNAVQFLSASPPVLFFNL